MDWVSIIVAIISALAGGGLISLLTLRETKKSLRIDNQVKEDDRWSKLADELQDENTRLNEKLDKKDARITLLEDTISALRTELGETKIDLVRATLLKCDRVECATRKPPFGYRNIDLDKEIE